MLWLGFMLWLRYQGDARLRGQNRSKVRVKLGNGWFSFDFAKELSPKGHLSSRKAVPSHLFFPWNYLGRRGKVGHVSATHPQQEGLPTAHQATPPVFIDNRFHFVAPIFKPGLEPLSKLLTVNTWIDLIVFARLDLESG